MDVLRKLLTWLRSFPVLYRVLLLLLGSALAFILSLNITSCGTPKTVATVQNVNPNSSVTVTMTVSNSTSTTVPVKIDSTLND